MMLIISGINVIKVYLSLNNQNVDIADTQFRAWNHPMVLPNLRWVLESIEDLTKKKIQQIADNKYKFDLSVFLLQ